MLQEAATQIRAIEPPDELADDWTSFADGIEEIAKAAQVDFHDQAAVAKFQQQVGVSCSSSTAARSPTCRTT